MQSYYSQDVVRQVPVYREQEVFRPSFSFPRWSEPVFPRVSEPVFPRVSEPVFPRVSEPVRYVEPIHTPMPTWDITPATAPTSSTMEREMKRMNEEMQKMMTNMQKSAPVGTVDDWRLTENFNMENPIRTEYDGGRKFKLQFDMRQYKPEEIQVRTVGNQLSVAARHEEKDSNKSAFAEYQRKYVLPKEINPELMVSKLSPAGVLTIEAPLPSIEGPREKMIPIEHRK